MATRSKSLTKEATSSITFTTKSDAFRKPATSKPATAKPSPSTLPTTSFRQSSRRDGQQPYQRQSPQKYNGIEYTYDN